MDETELMNLEMEKAKYKALNNILKPCPFCCGRGAKHKTLDTGMYYITCVNCFIKTRNFDTEVEAVDFWSRRI